MTLSTARSNALAALLTIVGLVACWMATSLSYAVLVRPAQTFAVLHGRGTSSVPALVWAASRDLARRVVAGPAAEATHD